MDSSTSNLLKILMNEMDSVNDQCKINLERCEMPPFYRFQNTLETTYEKQVGMKIQKTAGSELTALLKVFILIKFYFLIYRFILNMHETFICLLCFCLQLNIDCIKNSWFSFLFQT